MKRASSDSSYVFDEKGLLLGLYLAADHCAEHESGIRDLRESFGVNRKPHQLGIEFRRAIPVPRDNILLEKRKNASLLIGGCSEVWSYLRLYEDTKPKKSLKNIAASYGVRVYSEPKDETAYGAWSNRGFVVYAVTPKQRTYLEDLYQAFLDDDGIIMLGGGKENPFSSPGLALGIISRLPDDIVQGMYAADKNAYDLKQAAEATGIYEIIDRSKYFALSPRWYKPDPEDPDPYQTEHPVIFWLNPYDQQNNGCGYFTVEDLTAWARGEALDGPIAGRGNLWSRKQRAMRYIGGDKYELFDDEVCCSRCAEIINIGNGYHDRKINVKYAKCPACDSKEHLIPKARLEV